jgi:hypothetical protein
MDLDILVSALSQRAPRFSEIGWRVEFFRIRRPARLAVSPQTCRRHLVPRWGHGLDEHLEVRHFAGLICIGAGLAAIDGRFFLRRAVAAS